METLHTNVLVLLAVLLGSIFEAQHGISGEEKERRVVSLNNSGRFYGILPGMHPTAQLQFLMGLSDLPLKTGILLNLWILNQSQDCPLVLTSVETLQGPSFAVEWSSQMLP